MNKKAFMYSCVGLSSAVLLNNHFNPGTPNYELNYLEKILLAYGVPALTVLGTGLYIKHVKKKEVESLLQPAVENKEISTGLFNLAHVLPVALSHDPSLNNLKILSLGLFVTTGVNFTLEHFSKHNIPYLSNCLNWVETLIDVYKSKSPEEKQKMIISQQFFKDERTINLLLANLEMHKENPDIEKAINYELNALQDFGRKENPLTQLIYSTGQVLLPATRKILGVKQNHLGEAVGALEYQRTNHFIKHINDFVEEKPSVGSKSLRVFALEKIAESNFQNRKISSELKISWESLLNEIMAQPEIHERFRTIEGKPVYTINLYNFMNKMLVLKEGNYEELKDEHDNLLRIKEQNLEVVEPIKIVQHKGKFYLAQKYANGEPISKVFERTKDLKLVTESLEVTKALHDFFPKKEKNDSQERTIKKIMNSKLPRSLIEDITQNLSVAYKLASSYTVFDCDAHLDNFILSNGRIVILDKPSRGYIFPEEDYAKLVDRGQIYESIEQKFEDLLKASNNETQSISTLALTTPKAITYTIYEMNNRIVHSVNFLRNAVLNLKFILEKQERYYSSAELKNLAQLKFSLENFQSIVA